MAAAPQPMKATQTVGTEGKLLPSVHSPFLFTPPLLMHLSDNFCPAQEEAGLAVAPHRC